MNRVWIELEYPEDTIEGELRAKLASNMLQRLGYGIDRAIFWHEKKMRYCVTVDGDGFLELQDKGHWFNLDHFGRD